MAPIPIPYRPRKGGARHNQAFKKWLKKMPENDPRRFALENSLGPVKRAILQRENQRLQAARKRKDLKQEEAEILFPYTSNIFEPAQIQSPMDIEDDEEIKAMRKGVEELDQQLKAARLELEKIKKKNEEKEVEEILEEMRVPPAIEPIPELEKTYSPWKIIKISQEPTTVKSWREDPRREEFLNLHPDEEDYSIFF